ncbi:MAG TPA: hypothetical protein VLE74_01785 [Candidatus Saccharimonadales bacterium]|nr:hypothetical protein [Candidatus Saccharimonadales bacterium]
MDKRNLHHIWTRLRKISYGYFLIAFIVCAITAVFALRHNNLTALYLRDQVLKTDQQNGNTEAALQKLRTYVYGHMNTNLTTNTSVYPPIQLKYRYERLVAAEQARVAQANAGNNVYNDAQKYCEATQPQSFFGAGRLPCIQNYLDSHPAPTVVKEQPIPDAMYKFDFISPAWSPDLAGWSLVFAGFFFLLFAIRFLLERWLRYQLNQHA